TTLVDTAGDREDGDRVEQRGVELGRRRAAQADVLVQVVDASAAEVDEYRGQVIALNKIDLVASRPTLATRIPVVPTSALHGTGLDALRAAILAAAGSREGDDEPVLASARQHAALVDAAAAFDRGAAVLATEVPAPELAALELREAAKGLE